MDKSRLQWRRGAAAAIILAALGVGRAGYADEPARIEVTIKDHRFTPAEIHVPKGKPSILVVRNDDATAEEFESSALNVEKVIAPGSSVTIRLRSLSPGRYPFVGEFHEETAKGVVIVE